MLVIVAQQVSAAVASAPQDSSLGTYILCAIIIGAGIGALIGMRTSQFW